MDAGYFLGIAQSLKRQQTTDDFFARRSFPDGQKPADNAAKTQPAPTPLLSKIIYWLAADDSPKALLQAGNQMIPITAALTAMAIIICFGATGYWLEGGIAAVGGRLSMAYLQRSSIGRIDTDQLNLGFSYLLFGLAIWAGRAKHWASGLAVTIMAGLTARLFMDWYGKSELIWMAFFALFWMVSVSSRDWRRILGYSIIFILLSGVGFFDVTGSAYIKDIMATGDLAFPNVLTTVSEVTKIDFQDMLFAIAGSPMLGLLGVIGMVLWAIRHPVFAIALGPLAVFALFNFVIGNRAIFYSAPAVWFGLAFLLITLCRIIFHRFREKLSGGHRPDTSGNLILTTFVFAGLLAGSYLLSPYKFVPKPAVPPEIVKGLKTINHSDNTAPAVMASWWDYGYSSLLFNNLPVLADGGSQVAAPTFMMAKALLAPTQQETAAILKFMAREGSHGIAAHATSQKTLFDHIRASAHRPAPTIYFMLTSQMNGWIYAISKIGNWDLDTGKAVPIPERTSESGFAYRPLQCGAMTPAGQTDCNGHIIDVRAGTINGDLLLDGAVHIRNGRQIGGVDFPGQKLNVFQIIEAGQDRASYLLNRNLFRTSFNQLFHLGRANPDLFEMVYDAYPHVRIFKLQSK